MTYAELQELTDVTQFEMIAVRHDTEDIMFAVPIPGASHLHYITSETGDPIICDPIDDWMEEWDKYANKLLGCRYRTKQLAGKTDKIPDKLPIITLRSWENAMTLTPEGSHLIVMRDDIREHLEYTGNALYYDNQKIQQSDLDMMINVSNASADLAKKIDLHTLRLLYGIILEKYSKNIEEIVQCIGEDAKQFLSYNVTIYIPDFFKATNMSRNINQQSVDRLLAKMGKYSSLWGVVKSNALGKERIGYYPVLVPLGYEKTENTVTFTSPYMNRIITLIIQDSIRRDKDGVLMRGKSGRFITNPSHSYHVKASIIKDSSEWAKDVVEVISVLLDRAGNNLTHIRFSKIIGRCYGFNEYLEAQRDNYKRNKILNRTFSRAWKLLATDTDLKESFKDLELPDPKNPQTIPRMDTLDDVITFPHKGKIKKSNKQEKQPPK